VVDTGHERHYRAVLRELTEGDVVPLLGAGVNLWNRGPEEGWERRSDFLPSGQELAEHLAATFFYPRGDSGDSEAHGADGIAGADGDAREGEAPPPLDLLRVSQYVATTERYGPLYRELRKIFEATHPWTPAHSFFARFPGRMRERGAPRYQLIVTTNYDDQLERAFDEVEEPYDVVWYIADPEELRGKFWHRSWQKPPERIEQPRRYTALPLGERTVILKIHGAIDRDDADRDSFVITEDHYIDYLTKTDIDQLLPPAIIARLRKTCFLFLGYSMADWNLRVILHRIWGEQPLSWPSWAVRKDVDAVEAALWDARNVAVLDVRLEVYIAELERRLELFVAEPVR